MKNSKLIMFMVGLFFIGELYEKKDILFASMFTGLLK